MSNGNLLWADDEIELLRPHILFLNSKGYDVTTVSNGRDAIDACRERGFSLVLLDEMMPGLSGLETLQRIKELQPQTPVVMVTKSEAENIMEEAIGQQIADYLIKPVVPSQILLTLKKHIHGREIVAEQTETRYQQNFRQIALDIADARTLTDWTALYRRLVKWELTLSATDSQLGEMLTAQKEEANAAFAKYIRRNYLQWVAPRTFLDYARRPMLSPDLFRERVFPWLDARRGGEGTAFFIVIDNLRYDHWLTLAPELAPLWNITDDIYLSILPTATQYARNAIFSGLMPNKIAEMFPELWVDEDSEEGKNLNEEPLVRTQIERFRKSYTFSYNKVNDSQAAARLLDKLPSLWANDINVVVINVIDMLSHARTESKMVRELASDEAAYRSLTLSWFRHSPIAELLRTLATKASRVFVTTDHGSIRTSRPVKIIGDRNTNTNLRYKLGRNLNCQSKDVFTIAEPHEAQLPAPNISTSYAFATGDTFFAYPNNYNYYASYYKDTFQHGGISMEEMLVPFVTLTPR